MILSKNHSLLNSSLSKKTGSQQKTINKT